MGNVMGKGFWQVFIFFVLISPHQKKKKLTISATNIKDKGRDTHLIFFKPLLSLFLLKIFRLCQMNLALECLKSYMKQSQLSLRTCRGWVKYQKRKKGKNGVCLLKETVMKAD